MSDVSPTAGGTPGAPSRRRLPRSWWVLGLAIAGVVAALAATFASGDPDGLNAVAIEQGFDGAGTDPGFQVLPGYAFPGLDGTVSTTIAGLAGIAIVFLLVLLLGRLLARRRRDSGA